MRDIRMPQIGRQGHEVPSDRGALGAALLQDPCCEGMAEVVDARPPGPPRSNIRKLQDAAEGTVHCRIGERGSLHRQKQVIVQSRKTAADIEIAVKSLHDAAVQRHQAALVELGFADTQKAAGQHIAKPEMERF